LAVLGSTVLLASLVGVGLGVALVSDGDVLWAVETVAEDWG
jgi:hypothetical protein